MPYLWLILPVLVFGVVLVALWSEREGAFGSAFAMAVIMFLIECAVSGAASLFIPQISTHVHYVQVIRYELAEPPTRTTDANGHRSYRFYYMMGTAMHTETAQGEVTLHPGAAVPRIVITRTIEGETDCRDAPGYQWLRHVVFWNPDRRCALAYNRAETTVRYDFYLDARGVID